jgi:DNA-binding GntR family transcriptional regulator
MSDASRKELHELVNALPPGEEQAARRYLEYLTDAERAKLHASLRQAEAEIAAGKSTAAEDLLRELRAGK